MPVEIVKLDVQVEGYVADPFSAHAGRKSEVNLSWIKENKGQRLKGRLGESGNRFTMLQEAIHYDVVSLSVSYEICCSMGWWTREQAANGQAALNRVILCYKT